MSTSGDRAASLGHEYAAGADVPGKGQGSWRPAGERSASTSVSDLKLGGSDGKESACSVGDLGSMPGSGRSPAEGNGNSLQYSCLETRLSEWHFHTHMDDHVCQKCGSVAWDYANAHNSDGGGVSCIWKGHFLLKKLLLTFWNKKQKKFFMTVSRSIHISIVHRIYVPHLEWSKSKRKTNIMY